MCTCLSEEAGILRLGLAFLLLQLLVGTLGQRPADQKFALTDGELHTCWDGYRDDRQAQQVSASRPSDLSLWTNAGKPPTTYNGHIPLEELRNRVLYQRIAMPKV